MMHLTTAIGLLVVLLLLALVLNNIRKKGLDKASAILVAILIFLVIMIVLPKQTNEFVKLLGFYRAEIAFLALAVFAALFLAIKNYFKGKDFEKNITTLTREIAYLKRKVEK